MPHSGKWKESILFNREFSISTLSLRRPYARHPLVSSSARREAFTRARSLHCRRGQQHRDDFEENRSGLAAYGNGQWHGLFFRLFFRFFFRLFFRLFFLLFLRLFFWLF